MMGHRLLEICSDYRLCIVNGTRMQDEDTCTQWTSIQPNGSSVIDYVVASDSLQHAA